MDLTGEGGPWLMSGRWGKLAWAVALSRCYDIRGGDLAGEWQMGKVGLDCSVVQML